MLIIPLTGLMTATEYAAQQMKRLPQKLAGAFFMLPACFFAIGKRRLFLHPLDNLRLLADNGTALVPKRGRIFNFLVYYPMRLGGLIWIGAGVRDICSAIRNFFLLRIYKRLAAIYEPARAVKAPPPPPLLGSEVLQALLRDESIKVIALESQDIRIKGTLWDKEPPQATEGVVRIDWELVRLLDRSGKKIILLGADIRGLAGGILRNIAAIYKTTDGLKADFIRAISAGEGINTNELIYIGKHAQDWLAAGAAAICLEEPEIIMERHGEGFAAILHKSIESAPLLGMLLCCALRPWLVFDKELQAGWTRDRDFVLRLGIAPVFCLIGIKNLAIASRAGKKACYAGDDCAAWQMLHEKLKEMPGSYESSADAGAIMFASGIAALQEYIRQENITSPLAAYAHLAEAFMLSYPEETMESCLALASDLTAGGITANELASLPLERLLEYLMLWHKKGSLVADCMRLYDLAAGRATEEQLDRAYPAGCPLAGTGFVNPDNILEPAALISYPSGPGTVGIHLHIHDSALAQEFLGYLRVFPAQFALYITYSRPESAAQLRCLFTPALLPGVREVEILHTPNRGRDIAPWLKIMDAYGPRHELFCHIHSKRSAHLQGLAGDDWRRYLLDNLLEPQSVHAVLQAFAADTKLGCVFPSLFPPLRNGQTSLYGTPGQCFIIKTLLERMGFDGCLPRRELFFSAGTMFWFRRDALRPLFDAGIDYADFPEEPLPPDGTLAHAVERVIPIVCSRNGYKARSLTLWPYMSGNCVA